MRKLIVSVAAAASALAVAAPAAAQYYPAPPPPPAYGYGYGYGSPYGAPYGNAYGYQNQHGLVRALQVRVDRLQGRLDRLAQRRIITSREYRKLHDRSHDIERRLRAASRYGLHPRERYEIEARIARLEHQIARDARDGRGFRRDDYHGEARYGYDRDRDGRDDRYEDDRGWDHD